jgi:acyl-CoA thioester hydrolase
VGAVFEWIHTVQADEADELGHANNEVYLRWMNRAAVAHSAALGWPTEAYLRQGQGWVVRRHEIEYLKPAWPGAELVVRTWVQTLEKATSWRCYAILARPDLTMLARGRTLWAWINYSTRRVSRIPVAVSGAFTLVATDVFSATVPDRLADPQTDPKVLF